MLSVVGFPIIALLIGVAGYRLKRIFAFVSRTSDSLGAGYQITESLKSFNRGGFFGIGIGRGTKILPEPFTDFIFSVYGEEAGFLGSLIIIILFAFLAYRGIKIAYKTNDNFLSLLAFGFTFLLISQAAINIMVTIGLLPTTGITLPFLSYGRSSLLVSSAMIGVLLNISRKSDNEA
jgi:cell division protein FtsW